MFVKIRLNRTAITVISVIIAVFLLTVIVLSVIPADAENTVANGNAVRVPIIMYHSVCINKNIRSEYIITPEKFERDIAWLKSNGYESIFVSDIINYVKNNGTLPEKPVVISLDDGFYNNLVNVLPILKKYGYTANVNVVGEYTEQYDKTEKRSPAYAYLSWQDISELYGSGRIEIGSHTYRMHYTSPRNGCKIMENEEKDRYEAILRADLSKLSDILKDKCNISCNVFAYPFGALCEQSVPVLKSLGFEAALTCEEKVNVLSRGQTDLFRLGRFNRASHYGTEEFMEKISLPS